jgi:hypothetical protein
MIYFIKSLLNIKPKFKLNIWYKKKDFILTSSANLYCFKIMENNKVSEIWSWENGTYIYFFINDQMKSFNFYPQKDFIVATPTESHLFEIKYNKLLKEKNETKYSSINDSYDKIIKNLEKDKKSYEEESIIKLKEIAEKKDQNCGKWFKSELNGKICFYKILYHDGSVIRCEGDYNAEYCEINNNHLKYLGRRYTKINYINMTELKEDDKIKKLEYIINKGIDKKIKLEKNSIEDQVFKKIKIEK